MWIYSKKTANLYAEVKDKIKFDDSKIVKVLAKINFRGKSVLDMGCGDGRYSLKFLKNGASKVTAIDISPRMLALTKRNTEGFKCAIRVVKADARKIPVSGQSFDVVFSSFVLQHIKDHEAVFKEAYRVLKQAGFFIVAFGAIELHAKYRHLYDSVIPIRIGGKNGVVVEDLIKSESAVKTDLSKAGFRIRFMAEYSRPSFSGRFLSS